MSDTPNYDEPSGSAEDRLESIKHLEDGDAAKAAEQPFYGHVNDAMLGADVGMTAVEGAGAGLGAAGTALLGGASGSAAAGAGAIAAGTVLLPVSIAIGGSYAMQKLGVTDWLSNEFVLAGDALGLTIGRGDPHPACVGDKVAHSSAFWGIVAGIAVGVAIGVAVAATVATGGLAGAVIVGACMAGGLTLGSALASASQHMGSDCGEIKTGSDDVYFEGKKVARVTDLVACEHHSSMPQPIVDGSKTIFINNLPLARIGHETHCSGKINSGRNSIWIDKTTGHYGPKNPELTAGQEFLAGLLGAMIGAGVGKFAGSRIHGRSTESAETAGIKDETRPTCEDPVDPVSGEVLEVRTDLTIPGVLPLQLKRRYRSRSGDDGLLGPRWSDNWSQRLELSDGRFVRFHDGSGLVTSFDAPQMALDGINLREPRYRLVGSRLDPRILDRDTRQLHFFAPLAEGRPSRLQRIEDLDGNSVAFAYDARDRLIQLTHSDGYQLTVRYHASSRMPDRIALHEEDGTSRTLVDYRYSEGMLTEVASLQCGQFSYTYDEHGWMTGWRDTDQTDVRYLYDHAGRVVETGTKQGYHTGRFVYEDSRTRVINASGEWIYEYNDEGFTTAETDPLGHRTGREWELGRLMSKTDALGRRTVYRYDDRGQLVAIEEPSRQITGFSYDDKQQLTTVVLSGDKRIQLEYDHLRRLVARTEPDGTKTGYRYGSRGELLRIVEGDRETRFGYDEKLRMNEIRLPTGATIRRTVDVLGRLLEETDPDGQTTRYDYTEGADNPRGSMRSVSRPDGSASLVRYNSEGLPVEWIDPLGRSISKSYGPFDLLTGSTDAAGHITRFEYDHATRLTKVINALAETYEYRYDGAGRLAQETDWGGRVTRYERDAAGRLLTKTLPDGEHWHFSYDALDRLSALDAGDVKLAYRYDARGRLASAEVHGDSPHVTHFAYDAKGRLIGEDQHGELLRHVYDAQGQRVLRVTPHRETQYAYDTLGALTQVGSLSILRDALGRETGQQAGDFVSQREFDALGRIRRQIAGPRLALESKSGDAVRSLEQLTRQVYEYDAAGQLERVETDSDTFTWQRDVRGQATALQSLRQPAEYYSYDANLNIAAHGTQGPVDLHHYGRGGLPEQAGYARYRYDARGRTIEKRVEQPGFRPRTWQYTWDGLNRLVKVITPEQGAWVYRYDAFNRRVEKRQAGAREAVKFLWDGYVLAERWQEKRDGTTGQAVTWHIEQDSFTPLAQETDDGLYPVLTDQVGLPKVVFDKHGKRVWDASYSMWGRLLSVKRAANDGAAIDTTLRFPGQWADDESGLNYNLNRYYDPDSGQYLSSDPIGLAGGLRTHGYVHDPSFYFDPLGLAVCAARYNRYKAYRDAGYSPREATELSKLGRVDFYVNSNGEALPAVGYRYMNSAYAAKTMSTMRAPLSYFGFEDLSTGAQVRDGFQIFYEEGNPASWSDGRLKGKFDTLQLFGDDGSVNARVPLEKGDKGPELEPVTSAYPEYGAGGQAQLLPAVKGTQVDFDEVTILPENDH
ncbi:MULTISPECIES: DUF6531 domain-containing protein [Paraburkholderia]|uniref:DUF6531 domain-containing protein n=1 Tax=Paraburkholderia TaxID=1822464 RepID=UPI0022587D01|nr:MULTISPECIES: DUF6531 domain-containing protein [Paraburkholderia]MCX4160654.1 DUF6531 domain-containing protein [Paraburkholderia megapolitana]MDN7156152.1 DUF6531 domain-containing protein [Paraburkholderia sp. CHISQ3]MDQ6493196.1 DUF6531 domain-containing protein [Paraburkholderia megapolitana]